ncbi:MAG: putative 4-deoxy-4-formamido-L-arabinose-phosphoundecaprenol deformylase ArnD [Deltaproteobacteria bacterium ADurb.Bin151]|jgi:peptidoglycan/xylan/chitin deacetylase (PgdA/CDA1 family)|nr:MAG: putative 4-deoxy-4-formamido-L-arabinose-phosphoundecaprenol deformylase ArnD [Deltaproteobacteria bacterium ADurb.Bin151]HOQ42785.1 polysaccharide deacetylase family protein [Smithellaceae bacterium]HPL66554.1 polysaccharide deacetylase family protein [Smithellaceae bacterium]HQP25147.1 polysaccharide deacetylase family protein [Smithellaceae bacterium]
MGMLGLKIDVDTYWGMRNGVPRLLRTLRDFHIQGTFFLSIGPDNSGRAMLQLIKNPRFLKKMMKTKAASLYGWRTAFYGTLLPAPMIALSFPDLVLQIVDEGHEVQFHAWDHRRWQDELAAKPERWIEQWFEAGISGFEKLTGRKPTAFGAPSWLIDDRVLQIIQKYHFEYLSCTRAKTPFIYDNLAILEIPSDLPCFEELDPRKDVAILINMIGDGGNHVLPVHAEVEGGIFEEKFRELLKSVMAGGIKVTGLQSMKAGLDIRHLTRRKPEMELLPGRHSPCAV